MEVKNCESSILQRIYDSEINISLSWLWDGGVEWELGDHMNGVKAYGHACNVRAAIEDLVEAVVSHFPDSEFAKDQQKRINSPMG